jgi:beta-glucosidase
VDFAPGVDPIGPGVLLPGLPAIPSAFFRPAGLDQDGPGLRVEYRDTLDFAGEPQLARVEPRAELNYGFFELLPGLGVSSPRALARPAGLASRFSARWTGPLVVPASGVYTFALTSLGTARVYLDGQLLINFAATSLAPASAPPTSGPFFGGAASVVQVTSATVQLAAGQTPAILIEYITDAPGQWIFGEAMLRLGWQPPAGVVRPLMAEAVALAGQADVAVVVVRTYESEEMDRPNLHLPNEQDELIRAVAAANPRTAVVLMNAGPVETASWDGDVPAIVEAWYAGQEQGNAVARVLFGDVNPAGKLPLTFPRNETETPVATPAQYPGVDGIVQYSESTCMGYRGYDHLGIEPQYPFGHGLSYTTFEYSGLRLTPESSDGRQAIQVCFDLINKGSRLGVEVAQVYLGLPVAAAPPQRLVGWARVQLEPGERRQVTVMLDAQSSEHPLSFWNLDTHQWEIAAGHYQIYVGTSSRDIRLNAGFGIL